MKNQTSIIILTSLIFMFQVRAATIYVSTNGSHDIGNNFDTWGGAATNIHEAVALANSLVRDVLVSNGIFQTTNTLTVGAAYMVRGFNGHDVTTIARDTSAGNFRVFSLTASGATLDDLTIAYGRCVGGQNGGEVLMAAGTVLTNCVITNCALTAKFDYGNAVYCVGGTIAGCVISNCSFNNASAVVVLDGGATMSDSIITRSTCESFAPLYLTASGNNVAQRCRIFGNTGTGYNHGGADVRGGRMVSCLVYDNATPSSAMTGGVGLGGGSLLNCTIANNSASYAGGIGGVSRSGGAMTNCIVYGNTVAGMPSDYNGSLSAAWYSCAPELTNAAQGNLTDTPMFEDAAGRDYRLQAGSPLRDTGATLADVTNDIDGITRPQVGGTGGGNYYDMGAYEMNGLSGGFGVGFHGVAPLAGLNSLDVTFHANAVGDPTETNVTWYAWDFNNDTVADLSGPGLDVVTTNFGPGLHTIALLVNNSLGHAAVSTNVGYVSVVGSNLYVLATNATPQYPYDNWSRAATNLPDALAAALGGCAICVGDGVYTQEQELIITKAITIRGNGPESTTVLRNPSASNFRVFQLADNSGASLSGLTIANGKFSAAGGGVWMGTGTVVSNCVFTNCVLTAKVYGNGVYCNGGAIADCVFTNCRYDQAWGVVVLDGSATMDNSIIASSEIQSYGVLYLKGNGSKARRCRIFNNTLGAYNAHAVSIASGGVLINSLVFSNRSTSAGAGVGMSGGSIVNCTIVSNSATGAGGGLVRTGGAVTNCIIYYNLTNGLAADYIGDTNVVWNSCAPELTNSFQGNVVGDPLFLDTTNADFRLRKGSPCINAGANLPGSETALDLDGLPRLRQTYVDMGAYESAYAVGSAVYLR